MKTRKFTHSNTQIKRWPNAIGFGFGKCGQGWAPGFPVQPDNMRAVTPVFSDFPVEPENRVPIPECGTDSIAFLDCHPQIVYRNSEPDFFNDRNVQILLGKSANPANMLQNYQIPNASESEFLIEQTMDYSSIVVKKLEFYP